MLKEEHFRFFKFPAYVSINYPKYSCYGDDIQRVTLTFWIRLTDSRCQYYLIWPYPSRARKSEACLIPSSNVGHADERESAATSDSIAEDPRKCQRDRPRFRPHGTEPFSCSPRN